MKIKGYVEEDFVQYKYPCMFIGVCKCDFKCCTELNLDISICQNSSLNKAKAIDISIPYLYDRYTNNNLTKAICFGGLEPMLQFEDIASFVKYFRENGCNDDIVIYTGYYENEIKDKIEILKQYKNIVIKFGRYIPNDTEHYDEVLGVNLANKEQCGKKIS